MTGDWTEKDISHLRERWAAGDGATLIGRALGRTRNSVIGKAHRLGLTGSVTPRKSRARAKPSMPVQPVPPLPPPPPTKVTVAVERFKASHLPAGKLSMEQLPASGRCKRPLWDNFEPTPPMDQQFFCGEVTKVGIPYCEACRAVLWTGVISHQRTEKAVALLTRSRQSSPA